MDKLQKLFDAGIQFRLYTYPKNELIIFSLARNFAYGHAEFRTLKDGINWLWQAAKEYYPNAECFKEEREEG